MAVCRVITWRSFVAQKLFAPLSPQTPPVQRWRLMVTAGAIMGNCCVKSDCFSSGQIRLGGLILPIVTEDSRDLARIPKELTVLS